MPRTGRHIPNDHCGSFPLHNERIEEKGSFLFTNFFLKKNKAKIVMGRDRTFDHKKKKLPNGVSAQRLYPLIPGLAPV